jgi:DNA polymerase-3 subunit delta
MIHAMAKTKEPFRPTAEMRVILLRGQEPFVMRERVRQITSVLEKAFGSVQLFTVDGAGADLAAVLDEARSYGLLGEHKLVVLEKADVFLASPAGDAGEARRKQRRSALERYVESPVEHATLVLLAETWRAGKLDKLIAGVGMVHVIETVDASTAVKWCEQRCAKQHGAEIQRAAAEALVARIGTSLTRLDQELGKLASFAGPDRPVSTTDVAELVGLSREEQVWIIQAALAGGDPIQALRTVHEQLTVSRQPEPLVAWAITDLVRKLHTAARLREAHCPEGQIAGQAKIWGQWRGDIMSASRRADPRRLAQLLRQCLEADRRTKRGFGKAGRTLEGLAVLVTDSIGRS